MDNSNKEIQYKLRFIESSLNPRSTCNQSLSWPTLHVGAYLPYFTTVLYKPHSSASQSEDDFKAIYSPKAATLQIHRTFTHVILLQLSPSACWEILLRALL